VINGLKDEIKNQVFGNKDSLQKSNIDSTKKNAEKTIKNTLKDIFKKPKKPATDTIK
jgi:hypothetical protein